LVFKNSVRAVVAGLGNQWALIGRYDVLIIARSGMGNSKEKE